MDDMVKRKDIDWVSKLFGGISKLVSGLVWWEHLNYPNLLVGWFGGNI